MLSNDGLQPPESKRRRLDLNAEEVAWPELVTEATEDRNALETAQVIIAILCDSAISLIQASSDPAANSGQMVHADQRYFAIGSSIVPYFLPAPFESHQRRYRANRRSST
jgi:hypothetical protein